MPKKIWVKAAHGTAQFYQEVLEPVEDGPSEWVSEHVYAETNASGKQVPHPVQVTDTPAVRKALSEMKLGTDDVPARIVLVEDDEVKEYLARTGREAEGESEAKPG